MKLNRRIASVALLGALSLASATVFAQQTIKIGAINPYSGPMALYGTEVTRGYELAVDFINAKGGVLGKKIE